MQFRIFTIALLITPLTLGLLSACGREQSSEPIPGFRWADGVYTPDLPTPTKGSSPWHMPWPKMPGLDNNPMTPEKVNLGRLLFFDPIMSGDNTTSCATCHHPDHGLSDGRARSMGSGGLGAGPLRAGGRELGRNSPTLWNCAFNFTQFWDGRAQDLEHQARFPIEAPDEMDQDPDELVWELSEIPEYVQLFAEAFPESGEDAVTYENVVRAVTSFERTLISTDAPFDRFVQGDENALTPAQQLGFNLFTSPQLRCVECHIPPIFSDRQFHVIGVPGGETPDPGRAKVPGEGPPGAFKVPTLRNITKTAPYMHNGAFATLDEVLDFYVAGAGHAFENASGDVDPRLKPFSLREEDRAALLAFFDALTDTTNNPVPPEAVPSGLPVIGVSPAESAR
jgi:cytochrome c peroxidase